MKRNLLILVLSILFIGVQAQDLVISPNPMNFEGEPSDWDYIAHTTITNNTSETVTLLWRRIESELPSGWISLICDNNLCYGPNTSECPSSNPVVLMPGQAGIFDVHTNSAGLEGEASVELEIFLPSNPDSIITTGVYNFSISSSTSLNEVNAESITLFPNPTTDYFRLSENNNSIASIEVYNLIGDKVKTFDAEGQIEFPIADLQNGLYMVSLLNKENGILKTTRLTKR